MIPPELTGKLCGAGRSLMNSRMTAVARGPMSCRILPAPLPLNCWQDTG